MAETKLRPSSAGKWSVCPGSVEAERGCREGDTTAADTGTVAHWIAAKILRQEQLPEYGSKFVVVNEKVEPALVEEDLPVITFDLDMYDHVTTYTDFVRSDIVLCVEEEVVISWVTGEEGATGTPDAVTTQTGNNVTVHDLKFGFNPVSAQDNPQLAIYAAGVLASGVIDILNVETVSLMIHQPRIGERDECTYTLEAFTKLVNHLKVRANNTRTMPGHRVAGEHCAKYSCKAQATCPVLAKLVEDTVNDPLNPLPDLVASDLSTKLPYLKTIRKWCDALEAEADHLALVQGVKIPGYKTVEGKAGKREWVNKEDAEAKLKAMRIKHDQMYVYSVVSPTQAEKLYKDSVIGKRQWPKLKELITRKASKNVLVPESDKRPAIDVIPDVDELPDLADNFNDLTGE